MNDRLYRSVDDRVLAGVCGGLADRLDLDPALVRIGYVILTLVTAVFPLVVLYVIMAIVIPEEPNWTGVRPVSPQATGAGWPAAGAPPAPAAGGPGTGTVAEATPPADVAVAGTAPAGAGSAPGWIPPGAPGAWDAGGWREQRRAARAARRADRAAWREGRRSDPVPTIIVGLFLVALGAFFLLRNTFAIDWDLVWPVVIIAFGAVVLVAAVRPRSG